MFRCPYSDSKVWCDRRESEDDNTIVCDSCDIIVLIGWDMNGNDQR